MQDISTNFQVEGLQMAVEDFGAPPVEELLNNHVQWTKQFTQPKPLGIEKAVAIVTCMDGRVFPAKQVKCCGPACLL